MAKGNFFFFFFGLLLPNEQASPDQCCHLVIFYFLHITLIVWGSVWKATYNKRGAALSTKHLGDTLGFAICICVKAL